MRCDGSAARLSPLGPKGGFQRGGGLAMAGCTSSKRRVLPSINVAAAQRPPTSVPICAVPTDHSRNVGGNFGSPTCLRRTNWTCWPATGGTACGSKHSCTVWSDTALTEPKRCAAGDFFTASQQPPMRAPREVTMRERFMTSFLCRAESGSNAPLTSRCPLVMQRTKFGTRCDCGAIGRQPE